MPKSFCSQVFFSLVILFTCSFPRIYWLYESEEEKKRESEWEREQPKKKKRNTVQFERWYWKSFDSDKQAGAAFSVVPAQHSFTCSAVFFFMYVTSINAQIIFIHPYAPTSEMPSNFIGLIHTIIKSNLPHKSENFS